MLAGKKILLGVCGSIAAYKAALITRLLVKASAEVQVVMTASAADFITPLTLATLSGRPALRRYFDVDTGVWNSHVEMGLWADALLVAPLSASTLAKLANGQSDNLLTATYLSARCPVFVAPAMDLDMYAHPAVQANLEKLTSYGNHIIPAEAGELASGLSGAGRLAEPERVVATLSDHFATPSGPWADKHVLITTGPTHEAIDPVRFIGNRSSGKMGHALAAAFAERGARVTVVSGPTALRLDHPRVTTVPVTSAAEMHQAAQAHFPTADLAVLAAAVADYTPQRYNAQKIKKNDEAWHLPLTRTVDIAAALVQQRQPHQRLVGFALETENEVAHAREKLIRKNLDLIVLNSLNDVGAGFQHDTNQITIVGPEEVRSYPLKPKPAVAEDIVDYLTSQFYA